MTKYQNSFALTGFVAKSAEIKNFEKNSVARFPISVGEKKGNEFVSALVTVEKWGKPEDLANLTKGRRVVVKGFFRPDVWTDKDGKKNSRLTLVATSIEDYQADEPAAE